ncbi:MAG: hypothetical protein ACI89Z_001427 [Porticoccus sp.]|jgi:uncharacterized protein involved in response to NO
MIQQESTRVKYHCPEKETKKPLIFRLAFRQLFLFGSVFSIIVSLGLATAYTLITGSFSA